MRRVSSCPHTAEAKNGDQGGREAFGGDGAVST